MRNDFYQGFLDAMGEQPPTDGVAPPVVTPAPVPASPVAPEGPGPVAALAPIAFNANFNRDYRANQATVAPPSSDGFGGTTPGSVPVVPPRAPLVPGFPGLAGGMAPGTDPSVPAIPGAIPGSTTFGQGGSSSDLFTVPSGGYGDLPTNPLAAEQYKADPAIPREYIEARDDFALWKQAYPRGITTEYEFAQLTPSQRAEKAEQARHQIMVNQLDATKRESARIDAAAPTPQTPDQKAASDRWLKIYGAANAQYQEAIGKVADAAITGTTTDFAASQKEIDAAEDKLLALTAVMPAGTELPANTPWGYELLRPIHFVLDKPQEVIKGRLGENAYDLANNNAPRHTFDSVVVSKGITNMVGVVGEKAFEDWSHDAQYADVIKDAYEHGWQKNEQSEKFEGGRAVWEMFIDSQDTLTRGLYDTGLDPWNYLFVAKGATAGTKAFFEAAELAKAGKLAGGALKVIEAADFAAGGWVEPVFDRLRFMIKSLPSGIFNTTPSHQAMVDAANMVTSTYQTNAVTRQQYKNAGWLETADGVFYEPGTVPPGHAGSAEFEGFGPTTATGGAPIPPAPGPVPAGGAPLAANAPSAAPGGVTTSTVYPVYGPDPMPNSTRVYAVAKGSTGNPGNVFTSDPALARAMAEDARAEGLPATDVVYLDIPNEDINDYHLGGPNEVFGEGIASDSEYEIDQKVRDRMLLEVIPEEGVETAAATELGAAAVPVDPNLVDTPLPTWAEIGEEGGNLLTAGKDFPEGPSAFDPDFVAKRMTWERARRGLPPLEAETIAGAPPMGAPAPRPTRRGGESIGGVMPEEPPGLMDAPRLPTRRRVVPGPEGTPPVTAAPTETIGGEVVPSAETAPQPGLFYPVTDHVQLEAAPAPNVSGGRRYVVHVPNGVVELPDGTLLAEAMRRADEIAVATEPIDVAAQHHVAEQTTTHGRNWDDALANPVDPAIVEGMSPGVMDADWAAVTPPEELYIKPAIERAALTPDEVELQREAEMVTLKYQRAKRDGQLPPPIQELREAPPRIVPLDPVAIEDQVAMKDLHRTADMRAAQDAKERKFSRSRNASAAQDEKNAREFSQAMAKDNEITLIKEQRSRTQRDFYIKGEVHPHVRDRIVTDELNNQTHNIEIFDKELQAWEPIHTPIHTSAQPSGQPARLRTLEEKINTASVHTAINDNLWRTPNRGKIIPKVADEQLFGTTVREYRPYDFQIDERKWHVEGETKSGQRADPYAWEYKPILGAHGTATFGNRELRFATRRQENQVEIQMMDDNGDWFLLHDTGMTKQQIDNLAAEQPKYVADTLNEILNAPGVEQSPKRAYDAARNLGLVNQPQTIWDYAHAALRSKSEGYRNWVDYWEKQSLDAMKLGHDLTQVQLPQHVRTTPLIRNMPISSKAERRFTTLMTKPNPYSGVRDTQYNVFNKQLEKKFGPGVNVLNAHPSMLTANYADFVGVLIHDRGIPDPRMLGKVLDRLAAHYSEVTLLLPHSLPRQLFGNTIIGNAAQLAADGQLFAMREGLGRKHLLNLIDYAMNGGDMMNSEVGALGTRYGLGGWNPMVVGHTQLDSMTGRAAGSSALRATRDDLRNLGTRIDAGNNKTAKVLKKWAKGATPGWVGKAPAKAVDTGITYLEWSRNLINGTEYATRTSVAMHHTDNYIRRNLPGFVDDVIETSKVMGTTLRPSDIRAAIGALPKEFNAVDVGEQMEKLLRFKIPAKDKMAGNFGDRVGRDYANMIADAVEYGDAEMAKVLFIPEITKADTWIKRIVPFHLYTSRAIPYFAKTMLKHPGFGLAYYRAQEGLDDKARDEGWPPWMRGMLKVFNGPFGMDLYLKPLAALGFVDLAIEAGGGYNDADKPLLGRLYDDMTRVPGLGFYPYLVAPLGLSGALGDSSVMTLDPLGLAGARKYLGTAAQLLASTGILGDDLDRYLGKPYEQRLMNMREFFSGIIPGIDEVKSHDAGAGAKETIGNIWLDAELKRRHLSEADWQAAMVAGNLDPNQRTAGQVAQATIYEDIVETWIAAEETDDKGYQQATDSYAQGTWVTSQVGAFAFPVGGPRYTKQDAQLARETNRQIGFDEGGMSDGIAFTGDEKADTDAYVKQYTEEFKKPPTAEQLEAYIQAHPTEAQLAETTPEARGYIVADAQWHVLGTEASRTLQNTKNAIAFGYIDHDVEIAGQTFTAAQIKAYDADGRDFLAQQYLLANDPGQTVAILEREQDAFVESHPEFKEFRDWASATRANWREYDLALFRKRESEVNPGAADYYLARRRAVMTDHPEYTPAQIEAELDKSTFSMQAYFAIYGTKQRYSDPKPRGNGELAQPRGQTGGGAAVTSGGSAPTTLTSQDVSSAMASYDAVLRTANAYLTEQSGGQQVNYRTLIPPAQAAADKQLQYAGITMPDSAQVATDYMDWRDKQERLGDNSSVSAYVQMINAGGEHWRERRVEDPMPGGWYWVSQSGDDYVNEVGFSNAKEAQLDPMGQRITTGELIDQLLGSQHITNGTAPLALPSSTPAAP